MQYIATLLLLLTLFHAEQVGRPCPVDAKKSRLMCIDQSQKIEARSSQRRKIRDY